MDNQKLMKILINIIESITKSHIQLDKIEFDTVKLYELGIDSLMLFRFITEIEEKFKINFKEEDLDIVNFKTLSDVIKFIKKYEIIYV